MPRMQPLGYKRKGTRQGGPYKRKTTTTDTLDATLTQQAPPALTLPVPVSASTQQEGTAAAHSIGPNLDELTQGQGRFHRFFH